MFEQIFKTILLMSAIGSALIITLLCLKPVTKRLFSPNWQYYIWLTVLFVMILPVHFNVPTRTPNIPVTIVNRYDNIGTAVQTVQSDNMTAIKNPLPQTDFIQKKSFELPQNIFCHFANIWFWGMIAMLLAKIIKYNLFLRAIHKNSESNTDIQNLPKRLNLRKTDMLDAPLIVGLFKPTLFLPNTEIAKSDMNYILMHELTHYRRGDILYKWLAMFIASVHWFNPLVYIVSRQIDAECEISCDYAVTSKLSYTEKEDYMRMILDLLATSKSKFRPLTTQMANGKNTLKRRFIMIKTKKSTSKIVSIISLLLATIILSTSVFASGILTGLTGDDYTIDVMLNDEKINLINKPFIENGTVYIPLRETLEKLMSKEYGIVDVTWNDGTIDVVVAYYQGESGLYQFKIDGNFIKLRHINYEDYKNDSIEKNTIVTALSLNASPVLKNSVTYVTLKDINYMLYGYTVKRDENNNLRELICTVYDKRNAVLLTSSLYPIDDKTASATVPNYESNQEKCYDAVNNFFKAFEKGDIVTMKKYCTDEFVNHYFHNDEFLSMSSGKLKTVYSIQAFSNGDYYVHLKMTSADLSDENNMYYAIFEEQANGNFLIKEFQESYNNEWQHNTDITPHKSKLVSFPENLTANSDTTSVPLYENNDFTDKTLSKNDMYNSEKQNTFSIKSDTVADEPYMGFEQLVVDNADLQSIENVLNIGALTPTSGEFADLKTNYIISDCDVSDNRIKPDRNGNISIYINANNDNLFDIAFADTQTGTDVGQYTILANNKNVYSFIGFDIDKTYLVNIKSKTKSDWNISGKYIIY